MAMEDNMVRVINMLVVSAIKINIVDHKITVTSIRAHNKQQISISQILISEMDLSVGVLFLVGWQLVLLHQCTSQ